MDHHGVLPFLRASSCPNQTDLRWCTQEPQPRIVHSHRFSLPSVTGAPPEDFFRDYFPPGCISTLKEVPPTLIIKTSARHHSGGGGGAEYGFAFVAAHSEVLRPDLLSALFGTPFRWEGLPPTWRVVEAERTRPSAGVASELFSFPTVISLLQWLYSSYCYCNVQPFCHICCDAELPPLFEAVSRAPQLAELETVLLDLPIPAVPEEDPISGSRPPYQHGFDLQHTAFDVMTTVYFDTLALPYRTHFLEPGLLLVDRSAIFIQEVTEFIIPRGSGPAAMAPAANHSPRLFRLLVRTQRSALAIFSLLLHCARRSFNAKVDAGMLTYNQALRELVMQGESVSLSLEVPASSLPIVSEVKNDFADTVDTVCWRSSTTAAMEGSGVTLTEFQGSPKAMRDFVVGLASKALWLPKRCTMRLTGLPDYCFRRLFHTVEHLEIDLYKDTFLIKGDVSYLTTILIRLNERLQLKFPMRLGRRFVEIDLNNQLGAH